jgi:hypothetical protein
MTLLDVETVCRIARLTVISLWMYTCLFPFAIFAPLFLGNTASFRLNAAAPLAAQHVDEAVEFGFQGLAIQHHTITHIVVIILTIISIIIIIIIIECEYKARRKTTWYYA